MTAPRRILPGTTYSVTRRCAQRQFLLRPDKTSRLVFLYVLAVAAQRFQVEVHAFCVMSNHIHIVLTDRDARLPEFMQYLNAFVARAVNARRGRWDALWASGSYSAVKLHSPADIVDKVAYVLANPVSAALVQSGDRWPGAWSDPASFGSDVTIARPDHFFASRGGMPPEARLRLATPRGFESDDVFRRHVVAALAEKERDARRRVGGRFAGLARVLSQNPFARPSTKEPRRTLNPRIAALDTPTRVEALEALAEFLGDYRRALDRWRAGERDAVFPSGTYLMRVAHGVACVGLASA